MGRINEQGRFEAIAIETEKSTASRSTVIDENKGRDDMLQNPKRRGLDFDFTSMREDFQVALNTLSHDLKREIHDLRDSYMDEITNIREEFGVEWSLASGGGNTNLGPKIDVPKPSPFVGKREARAVDDFLWEMEQYLECVNMVDGASKIKMATRYLKDIAMLWWRHRYGDIERGITTIDTWAEFVADFQKQFYPENAKNEAKSQIRKLKQSETIREYIKEFTTLVLKIP
ncbi:actin-related protein 9 [Tanacetum coccineum]